jgi:hypothetical protein
MKLVIDCSLVADNLLFATHGHRCSYLGTPSWGKARWLNDNAGSFRRIVDIEQGSVLPELPVEDEGNVGVTPAAPTCETSPHHSQKEGDVALINTPRGDPPPYPSTSLPARVKTKVPDGSTRAELAPGAKALRSETSRPKAERASPGEMDRARGGSDARQKQSQPAQIAKVKRKLSPERMRLVLNSLRQYPFLWWAADKAGIHRKTLENWIRDSKAGAKGYDVKWQGITWRFHEHCESAIYEAHQKLIDIMFQRALLGYDKVLTRRGRVMYKIDQGLEGLGFQGPDAYLRDENGNPIPETVRKVDLKAMRFILELYRPGTWGKHPKIDAPHEGGVLVIGDVTKKPEYNPTASVMARKWKSMSRKIWKPKA